MGFMKISRAGATKSSSMSARERFFSAEKSTSAERVQLVCDVSRYRFYVSKVQSRVPLKSVCLLFLSHGLLSFDGSGGAHLGRTACALGRSFCSPIAVQNPAQSRRDLAYTRSAGGGQPCLPKPGVFFFWEGTSGSAELIWVTRWFLGGAVRHPVQQASSACIMF